VVAVHIGSDLDAAGHRLSEYVHGRGGSLMTVAFLMLGLGTVALGLAIASSGVDGWRTRLVTGALVAAGLAVIVAGLYPTEPGADTTAEIVHSRASGGATLLLIGAALSWSFRPGSGRLLRALAVSIAVLGGLSVALHETSATGLSQRLLWLALVAWLLIAALRVQQPESAPDGIAR
jgi:hypothetical protein